MTVHEMFDPAWMRWSLVAHCPQCKCPMKVLPAACAAYTVVVRCYTCYPSSPTLIDRLRQIANDEEKAQCENPPTPG